MKAAGGTAGGAAGALRRGAAGLAALALLASTGCANVVCGGPVVPVGEENRNETVLGEALALKLEIDRGALAAELRVRAVNVKQVKMECRSLNREYGYYLPYDPLVKSFEIVSVPFLFCLGAVLVYHYWTTTVDDGGVGEGDAVDAPDDPVWTEDVEERAREAALDEAVRDPSIGGLFDFGQDEKA